jgi:hypothetical protein
MTFQVGTKVGFKFNGLGSQNGKGVGIVVEVIHHNTPFGNGGWHEYLIGSATAAAEVQFHPMATFDIAHEAMVVNVVGGECIWAA